MKTRLSPSANFFARHSALVALAVFAIVGVFTFDDYGVSNDAHWQRDIGIASFDYILGDEDALIEGHHDRFYGVAFEVPLIAVERLLRLEDPRSVHLNRRLFTHLLFLAGGFFAWLLTYRLFGSRLVALFAMLIFLLHPRIYAHSFFNTKDLPFLSALMIALYLIQRAFRRDTVWAFALCGAGVGLTANIRIMGIMLIPAVLGMLALDVFYAMRRGGGGYKRPLANICAFSTTCAATLYAAWPLLWRDPLNLIETIETLSRHPTHISTLFRGELVQYPNVPWDFIPTWILITTPPAALLLAALGIGHVARLCAADWRAALSNSAARFGLLALACLTMPVAAAVALNSNMYDDWRQMYFLYAPICVFAAFGLRWLATLPKPSLRAAAFTLAALGIAVAAVRMVSLHPHQSEYFSPLVDKSGIADRWKMSYWHAPYKEALDALLETQPSGPVMASALPGYWRKEMEYRMRLIPPDDRRRLNYAVAFPSFRVFVGAGGDFEHPVIWKREVYGVPIAAILDVRDETDAAFQDAFTAAFAPEPAASAGGFDIYADGGGLVYLNEDCGEEDERSRFELSVFPTERENLPQAERDAGLEYERLDFDFPEYGARRDGKCAIVPKLPDYLISRVETAQTAPGGRRLWSVQFPVVERRERYARALSSLSGEPAALSGFDIWLNGGTLTYVKENCGEGDARARFALFVFPVEQSALSQRARDAGLEYERLDFDFQRYGARFDGKCVIVRYLPDYAISHIETGQWTGGESRLWSAQIPMGGYRERYERALSSLTGEPAARAGFDLWLDGGALTYVKENCDEEDARGRFFLSVFPSNQDDLPQSARDAGREHESLNFEFARYGAIVDGECVIVRRLPDYPIGAIETGQWIPGEGELWRTEIAVGD